MKRAARTPSREESKLLTRHRLMQATLQLLMAQGHEGLTTGRIAQLAGVAQATFYVHFRDIDDLLATLARDVVERLQPVLTRLRLQFDESQHFAAALRQSYRIPLETIVAHADLLRLFMTEYYRPNSPLGSSARALLAALSQHLYQDLLTLVLTRDIAADHLELAAETVVALTLQVGLGLAEHPERKIEQALDLLCALTMGALFTAAPPQTATSG